MLKIRADRLLAAFALAGCATVDVAQLPRPRSPRSTSREYFNGTVDGWGMFQDRSGKVVGRFHVRIDAKWNGNPGRSTSSSSTRTARSRTASGRSSRTATAIPAPPATSSAPRQGTPQGNALRCDYVLALPVDGTRVEHGHGRLDVPDRREDDAQPHDDVEVRRPRRRSDARVPQALRPAHARGACVRRKAQGPEDTAGTVRGSEA